MALRRVTSSTSKTKQSQRALSNVFSVFDQDQILEFKEAFNMMDPSRDGFICEEDLRNVLVTLGMQPNQAYVDGMMKEAPGAINFTMFLGLFGERLKGTDPAEVIRNAFACFDADHTGFVNEELLRESLTSMGDRFTSDEVDEMFRGAPIDSAGNFDYREFTRILKNGVMDA
ncbi:myosin regulatory light chain 2, smooth muscle minor isoform [Galendromus occidentalis]|uniref:Myosin regulatory light chain 2, smooth muscle minor isoform n=1 Tax=Galendromus occidentalis TaxID=34638 RepID=A0AAJ6VVW6_9ACAR|nr:myosin regulatory light chain 2, smooth muscle minor isoform [Galendromus occidentalis]